MDDARAVFQERLDVSRETLDKLDAYAGELRRWTRRINLVSKSTLDHIWSRHFLDSAQLWGLSPRSGHWVDLGSGGGFPGLVLAIVARDVKGVDFTLVESDQRKAAFLRHISRDLALNVEVMHDRIEDVPPLQADVLTARALAPLNKLLGYAERHRKPAGLALFPKGEKVETEISVALESWRFDCQKHPSISDARSSVLCVGEISRVRPD